MLKHPETKGMNIMLYSVTNDVKVGIPLPVPEEVVEKDEAAEILGEGLR